MSFSPPLRLGVLISGGGTTLQNLAEQIAAGTLNATIACVISSSPTVFGVERARKLGLPCSIITRKECGSLDVFSDRIVAVLREHKVDLVVMAGFLCLWKIPADLEGRVMNIHPALLPKFGGKGMHGHHVHEAVIRAGETESGCTVHFADNQYDTGPVIVQCRCPVLPGDSPDSLAKRVFTQECLAYPMAIELFRQNVLWMQDHKAHLKKTLGYVTRAHHGRHQILLFDHIDVPAAGTQVPAGTVHVGENLDAAVLREVAEETGLQHCRIVAKLGTAVWTQSPFGIPHERHFYHLTTDEPTSDTWEWLETSGGTAKPEQSHRFRHRWVDLHAVPNLAGDQGSMLPQLMRAIKCDNPR